MTILHRPGDIPRRIDFVRWFAANTRTGLQEGRWTLDQLIEVGRAYTPHSFTDSQRQELLALGVEVEG